MSLSTSHPLAKYLAAKAILITPKNHDEALAVQKKLFAAGVYWSNGRREVTALFECVKGGIIVRNGSFYYAHGLSALRLNFNARMNGTDFLSFDPEKPHAKPQPVKPQFSEAESLLLQEIRSLGQRLTKIEAELAAVRKETAPLDLAKIKGTDTTNRMP